jgi:hypothetical protein
VTVVAAIEALALVAVVAMFLAYTRGREKHAAFERRMLADRIQRPELLPVSEAPQYREPPIREDDQLNMVGKITVSDTYGIDEG